MGHLLADLGLVNSDLATSRAGGLLLRLPTAQAGRWNIQNLSQPNPGPRADAPPYTLCFRWVFFPDYQRSEWLNRLVLHLWPHLQNCLRQRLDFEFVGGALKLCTKIGSIPPRVGGVKVYEERTGRKEIILDVDLSWCSDCDVSIGFRGLGLPPVLAVREVFLRGTVR